MSVQPGQQPLSAPVKGDQNVGPATAVCRELRTKTLSTQRQKVNRGKETTLTPLQQESLPHSQLADFKAWRVATDAEGHCSQTEGQLREAPAEPEEPQAHVTPDTQALLWTGGQRQPAHRSPGQPRATTALHPPGHTFPSNAHRSSPAQTRAWSGKKKV